MGMMTSYQTQFLHAPAGKCLHALHQTQQTKRTQSADNGCFAMHGNGRHSIQHNATQLCIHKCCRAGVWMHGKQHQPRSSASLPDGAFLEAGLCKAGCLSCWRPEAEEAGGLFAGRSSQSSASCSLGAPGNNKQYSNSLCKAPAC